MSERTYEPSVQEEYLKAYRTMTSTVESAQSECADTIMNNAIDYDWCSQFGCEYVDHCRSNREELLDMIKTLEQRKIELETKLKELEQAV